MTEILCNLLNLGGRLWVLRVGVQDCIITIDKILNKAREYKTDERLRSYATIDKSDTREEKKSLGTHLGGTGGNCSDKRKAVEGEFCACGEPEAENYKWVRAK